MAAHAIASKVLGAARRARGVGAEVEVRRRPCVTPRLAVEPLTLNREAVAASLERLREGRFPLTATRFKSLHFDGGAVFLAACLACCIGIGTASGRRFGSIVGGRGLSGGSFGRGRGRWPLGRGRVLAEITDKQGIVSVIRLGAETVPIQRIQTRRAVAVLGHFPAGALAEGSPPNKVIVTDAVGAETSG